MTINKFLINKGVKSNTEKITILQMIKWVDEWQEKELLSKPVINKWVMVKDSLPENNEQVFVKYENGKYGINEWWESDNCWKYEFENMIIEKWCKPNSD